LELNGCSIEAYPSNHIDAFLSLTNPKFILIYEGDFFRKNEQDDVRHVSERYIAKSDPFIVMASTPNAPADLFQKIQQEPFDTYKKIFIDHTYGLDKIYTNYETEKAKVSSHFPENTSFRIQPLVGNCFSQTSIENVTKLVYDPGLYGPNVNKSVGVDAGFGSSRFAIVVTQYVDCKIQVIFAEEYERPNFQAMINRIWMIKQQCDQVSNICRRSQPGGMGVIKTRVFRAL
jgi:hypothetical protein